VDEAFRERDLLWVAGAPGSMAGWLEALAPQARYVLQPDSLDRSLGAVARRLTGHSLGLVLSGGGARALAHVGVIEELVAAGVVIDRVAGVSMGSLVGALFASGLEPDELDARVYDEWVRRNPLNDYRIPRHSLVKGDKVKAAIQRLLPGTVEEMPREFACVAADLKSGEEIVHRTGELWGAVGSSMSLPGLVAPLPLQGRLQVDGAVAHGLPLHLLSHEEGRLLASDVTARQSENGRPDKELRVPTIGETMFRVALLGGVTGARSARREADLLIVPSDAGVGLLEFHQLDQAKEAGRRAAAEALEQAPPELFV
jgi:predicted acylesterase/phospholipase RssA